MIITINDFGGGGGGSASSIKYEVVTELPTEGKVGVIYLIESEEPTEGDKFDEYIWLKDEAVYEKLGSMAKIDLDNYYTKEETDTELAKKQDTLISGTNIKTINGEDILGEGDITIGGDMSDYYTKEETDNKFVQKTVPSVSYVLLGVTHIDEYLDGVIPSNQYSGKTSYTDFIINEGIVSIGNNAFGACNGLTSVMIPNSVTSIGNSAFQGCKNLTSVKIPDSVTSFGTNVFQSCSGLTSANIPSTFTTVYEGMFYNCTKLSSIEIPKSVTSLGKNAFLGCSGLTSLEIPSSVTSVGQQALASLKSLTSITIPPSVTTFGSWAFDSNPTSGTLYCDEVWFNTYKSKLGNLANWTRKPLPKSLEERVTALEEQIGDINNALETIIG